MRTHPRSYQAQNDLRQASRVLDWDTCHHAQSRATDEIEREDLHRSRGLSLVQQDGRTLRKNKRRPCRNLIEIQGEITVENLLMLGVAQSIAYTSENFLVWCVTLTRGQDMTLRYGKVSRCKLAFGTDTLPDMQLGVDKLT